MVHVQKTMVLCEIKCKTMVCQKNDDIMRKPIVQLYPKFMWGKTVSMTKYTWHCYEKPV